MEKVNVQIFKKIKMYITQNYSHKVIIALLRKEHNITISLRTLSKMLKIGNLKRRNIEESSQEDIIIAILLEMEGSSCNLGYRCM